MITASDVINAKLKEEGGLPSLYYRISADYGRVEVARSISSPDTDDLFGSTMNVCAKINSMAPPNEMVIGRDLYYSIGRKSYLFNDYHFKRIGEYSIAGSRHRYPVYSVLVSKNRLDPIFTPINKNLKSYINQDYYQKQKQQQNAYNILLVDDEPDILSTFKTFLLAAHEGYNVDAFTESQKALQQFAQANPSYYDLVVMDIRMPGLNGLQLYYRLKAMNPTIKVLFVSALDAAQEMMSILPGVKLDDVVQKPVSQEQLLYKVKTALVRWKST